MGRQNLKKMNTTPSRANASPYGIGAPFRPSKTALRGAIVESAPVGDAKVHFYILPYCSNMEVYGTPFVAEAGVSVRVVCTARPSPRQADTATFP